MNILTIDDDDNCRQLLISLLEMDGHEVSSAKDGRSGIAAAKKNTPDLILLDALMPGIDGFKTCKIFKKDKILRKIPLLILTGLGRISYVEKAIKAGANGFIAKPIKQDLNKTICRKYELAKRECFLLNSTKIQILRKLKIAKKKMFDFFTFN